MKKSKLLKLFTFLAALSIVAASCSSDTTTADTTAGETNDDSSDTTASAAPEENVIDDSLTTYVEITLPDAEFGDAAPTCTGESNGVLEFGSVLPETGSASFLGPSEIAAVELAVADINAAGGVLGEDVVLRPGDSGDSGDTANQTVDRHLESGVDTFIGTSSSGVSFTILEKITEACKVMFSPANTSPDFTTQDPGELYFRTSPSDVAQGQILAELIASEGITDVAIMARQDPYGEGLLDFTKKPLEESGVSVETAFTYDPEAVNFDSEIEKVVAASPEAIVLIGFDESSQILSGFFEKGITNDQIYLVDGNVGNALGEEFEGGKLSGIRGTIPTVEVTSDFRERLLEINPEIKDFSYSPESYDAVMITALAAIAADSDNPSEIAKQINDITITGDSCTSFTDCVALLEAGKDIAFVGASGPSEFSQAGERTRAFMAVVQYG